MFIGFYGRKLHIGMLQQIDFYWHMRIGCRKWEKGCSEYEFFRRFF